MSFPKQLNLEEYFKCPIWWADEPKFVKKLNKSSDKYIKQAQKTEEKIMPLKKSQKSLKRWTKQKWRTPSGKPSGKTGEVYAPSKTISALKSFFVILPSLFLSR